MQQRRPLLVAYDVSCDEDRAAVRGALRLIGDRVQQSVWIVAPQPGLDAASLGHGLRGLIAGDDRLVVTRHCTSCWRALRSWPQTHDPLGWLGPQIVGPLDQGW